MNYIKKAIYYYYHCYIFLYINNLILTIFLQFYLRIDILFYFSILYLLFSYKISN